MPLSGTLERLDTGSVIKDSRLIHIQTEYIHVGNLDGVLFAESG